jgi:adenylyl-sulfate kinase
VDSQTKPADITRHAGHVDADQRAAFLGQRGGVVWITGLSGAGKSTIAYALELALVTRHRAAFVLDGDNVRHGLCADLAFSQADRDENIRRVGEVAALFAEAGVLAIVSFISPYRAARERARQRVGADRFALVFLDASLEVCEARDPKGLYRRARAGEIQGFTGISAPYEPPENPTLRLDTQALSTEECVTRISRCLVERGFLPPDLAEETL